MITLVRYFKKRETAINILLEKPAHEFNTGTYHKLRVEIKKLDALFDLLNYCSEKFKRKKTFKPIKLIFHQAGKIRELQLEEAMLKKYLADGYLSDFRINLKRKLVREQDLFFSILNKKLLAKVNSGYHNVIPHLKSINTDKVNSYLEKRRYSIRKLVSQSKLKTSQVHELRKRLKKLIFNEKSLTLTKKNEPDFSKDALTDLLGKWHDCQVMIRQIDSAMKAGGIKLQEERLLKKVETKIADERDFLYNKIIKIFPKD